MQTIPAFYFDREELAQVARRSKAAFRDAKPFQHVVLDDFVPAAMMELLIREFPGPEDIPWEMHGPGRTTWARDRNIDKLATSDETRFGPFTRHFMAQLNSATFLAFLEELTGTKGILPDVTYNHCGMHSTGRGGRLMIHTDVNRHPLGLKMHQYLNLILFLNRDWKEEYGGHLELWNRERKPEHRILPIANRVVLFDTGTQSLHGHPHPLTCPEDRRRNSLAVYYYLRDRPASPEYTGIQRAVHWVPTTAEDRAFATERAQRSRARLAALCGTTVSVGLEMIPFELPAGLAGPEVKNLPLRFLRGDESADREAFAAAHLRAALAAQGPKRGEFLSRYQPVALLGLDSANAKAVTCLMDEDGKLFTVAGPDSPELFWVGYLDEVLDTIERAAGR